MYKNMKLDVLVFYNIIQFYNHCTFIQCISYYYRLEDVVISDTMDNIWFMINKIRSDSQMLEGNVQDSYMDGWRKSLGNISIRNVNCGSMNFRLKHDLWLLKLKQTYNHLCITTGFLKPHIIYCTFSMFTQNSQNVSSSSLPKNDNPVIFYSPVCRVRVKLESF